MKGLEVFAFGFVLSGSITRAAAPPSIEDFAARPLVEAATLSPDGHYMALIQTVHGRGAAIVYERGSQAPEKSRLVMGEPEHLLMTWCHWATNTRLLCGFRGMLTQTGQTYAATRLASVDADGKNMRVLLQNSEMAQGQFQDRILNWNPGPPDTVLIEADERLSSEQVNARAQVYGHVGTYALPAVFELNVVTGALRLREHARDPIRHWITDKGGEVRLGWGFERTTISYFARLKGDRDWRRLSRFEVFSRENHFEPIAISGEEANKAYAYGDFEGREALWLIDLTDKEDPSLVFSHPVVDVGRPLIARDGRLLGVRYETNFPLMYFTDDSASALNDSLKQLFPGKFSAIAESSRDEKIYLIRSYSDREPPSFTVLDVERHASLSLGPGYPGRDTSTFGSMRSISYPARDGTHIPAYLSAPPAVPATNLPLIVMPHGGPIARDTWDYFFLRQFLVSRGYAVLQMNFRGSSGYGTDWFFQAHQDWGGLTYDDVVDGTRWAVQQGIADPRRICIVGWSFGGYLALVGAQRNADLFRCSIDIAGVSDLGLLIRERHFTLQYQYFEKQIGTDTEKLQLNSPLEHAAEFKVPLLMLHGDKDAQVPFEQSQDMDRALTRAKKEHRFIAIPDGDHQFSIEKDRATLLREVETFLGQHLAATATPGPRTEASP